MWTNLMTKRRCEGKFPFSTAYKAEKAAGRASLRARELIIGYECCDCGYWHIGHADPAQKIAHGRPFEEALIEPRVDGYAVCKVAIPTGREIYFSLGCRNKMRRRKAEARKARKLKS